MIPGLSSEFEQRLLSVVDTTVTDVTATSFADRHFALFDGRDPEARELGIEALGPETPTIVVTDATRKLGNLRIHNLGRNVTLFFDNSNWDGSLDANIRILGDETTLLFNDIGDRYVALPDALFRSNRQFLYWGRLASAVGCSLEIEGEDQGVVIGDDALISAGVFIRNHDMHSMHELRSGTRLTKPPVTTVLERHVWLGQDVLLHGCQRIGMGSIIGARSFVKGVVASRVVAVGTPARVLRKNISWGRSTEGMTEQERQSIGISRHRRRQGSGKGS
jgi:carbonic anhydrase/acetyltransferase-like protein (isoleucine patch superfamily)